MCYMQLRRLQRQLGKQPMAWNGLMAIKPPCDPSEQIDHYMLLNATGLCVVQ